MTLHEMLMAKINNIGDFSVSAPNVVTWGSFSLAKSSLVAQSKTAQN